MYLIHLVTYREQDHEAMLIYDLGRSHSELVVGSIICISALHL